MIVCADDFGLTPDICRAILDLAEKGRLSAVSSLVALPDVSHDHFALLVKNGGKLDLGLHLNLLSAPPSSAPAKVVSLLGPHGHFLDFRQLLRRCLAGRIQADEVAVETSEQYRRFLDLFGRPPDFMDSHLHIHQFPGIREGLLKFLTHLPPDQRPYVRNTWMPPLKIFRQRVAVLKAFPISLFGLKMKMLLKARGILTNEGFAGVYDYRLHRLFPGYLRQFIRSMEPGNAILMVHPGLTDDWRRMEYRIILETEIPTQNPFDMKTKSGM